MPACGGVAGFASWAVGCVLQTAGPCQSHGGCWDGGHGFNTVVSLGNRVLEGAHWISLGTYLDLHPWGSGLFTALGACWHHGLSPMVLWSDWLDLNLPRLLKLTLLT